MKDDNLIGKELLANQLNCLEDSVNDANNQILTIEKLIEIEKSTAIKESLRHNNMMKAADNSACILLSIENKQINNLEA